MKQAISLNWHMANRRLFSVFVIGRAAALVAALLMTGVIAGSANAQTNSTWTDNSGDGNWSDSTNWNPAIVPNNGGGTTYSVTIGAANSGVTMDVPNDTINNLTLGATDQLNLFGSLTLASGVSTNNGGIGVNALTPLSINSGASIINNGTISVSGFAGSDAFLNNSGRFLNNSTLSTFYYGAIDNATSGIFINSGTGTIAGDATTLSNEGTFSNRGTINLMAVADPNAFSNSGTFNNSGTLSVTDAQGFIDGGAFNNSGIFNNSGMLTFTGDLGPACGKSCFLQTANSGTFNNSGTINGGSPGCPGCSFTNSGTFHNSGTMNSAFNSFSNSGLFNNSGTLNNLGTLDNAGTINNSSHASLINSGTLDNAGTFNNTSHATLTNSGTLSNTGTIIDGGTINNTGIFTNSGAVTITKSGQFTTSTNYSQTAGSTFVNGTLTSTGSAIVNIQRGAFGGGGTINGNVLMGGTIVAGTSGHPLTLDINGNYDQTGAGIYTELISSKGNGLLKISGSATLDPGASLDIALLGGFDPKNGTSFTIMDYGSESGTFDITDPFFDGGTQQWVITSYHGGDGDDIVLTAEAAATDLVATPEPGTMLLLGMGLLGLGGYARKKVGIGA